MCIVSRDVVVLVGFSSLAALEVVKMTTFKAAVGGGLVVMAVFPLQCQWICTMIMIYPATTDGHYSNGLRGIGVVKTDNEPAMAHFIYINVYWHDNVHADVIVLRLMCHVGSQCANKILTYLLTLFCILNQYNVFFKKWANFCQNITNSPTVTPPWFKCKGRCSVSSNTDVYTAFLVVVIPVLYYLTGHDSMGLKCIHHDLNLQGKAWRIYVSHAIHKSVTCGSILRNHIMKSRHIFSRPKDQFHPYIIYGLREDCSNSIANALVLLQSCAEPLIYSLAISLSQWSSCEYMNISWSLEQLLKNAFLYIWWGSYKAAVAPWTSIRCTLDIMRALGT